MRSVTRRGVMCAIEEYEQLGRVVFLDRYEYGVATRFFLVNRHPRNEELRETCSTTGI